MRIVTIDIFVCVAILVATFYVDSYLSVGWAQAFVLDRIFPVTFGWIYWSFLIEWLYVASYFFAVGVLVAMLVRARNPGPWAAAVGVCFSLTYLILQTTQTSAHASGESADFAFYVWRYGQYAVGPIAAFAGARVAQRIRMRRNQADAAA